MPARTINKSKLEARPRNIRIDPAKNVEAPKLRSAGFPQQAVPPAEKQQMRA
jgi:hypothetical protein